MIKQILLHEWIFGVYLLVMAASLSVAEGFPNIDTGVFWGLLIANIAVILASLYHKSSTLWRLRLGYYIVAMNIAFQQMRTAIPALRDYRADTDLEAIDNWLIGATPSLILENWLQPLLSDIMSFCYFLYLPYLAISLFWYLFSPLHVAKRFYVGLFSLYGIGFLGYLIVPAAGPYLAMADRFLKPIEGGWLTTINATLIAAGSNGTDVFPSLHCAVSGYILFFDRKFKPWRYYVYLLPCMGLWISTVYLRYHYLIDLIAGFILAVFSLWLAFRIHPGDEHEIPSAIR
jgi:membrane-associated phospholipid phosphatase